MKLVFSTIAGYVAQANAPEIPGIPAIVEKGGVWAVVGVLMWWILGKLSKQIDNLQGSIDRLSEKIDGR